MLLRSEPRIRMAGGQRRRRREAMSDRSIPYIFFDVRGKDLLLNGCPQHGAKGIGLLILHRPPVAVSSCSSGGFHRATASEIVSLLSTGCRVRDTCVTSDNWTIAGTDY